MTTKMRAGPGMEAKVSDCALNVHRPGRPVLMAEPADDVRWERVARLRAAIEAGTYFVSSEALAERLMERMLRAGSQGRVQRDF
jgi:anti-sigma28 factor (negative regulator of flagellin synthesis)